MEGYSPEKKDFFSLKMKFDKHFKELCEEKGYGITRTIANDEVSGHIFTLGKVVAAEDGNYFHELPTNDIENFFEELVERFKAENENQDFSKFLKMNTVGENHYIAVNFKD